MNNTYCKFCNHKFLNEDNLNKHNCEEKKRHEFVKTAKGLSCFNYYKEWLKLSKKSTNVSIDTFLNSRYYNSFINFVNFANKMCLPNKLSFIKFMISKNLLPNYWCNDQIYIEYIKELDNNYSPEDQANDSLRTLTELCEIYNCKPENIFEELDTTDIYFLIKTRKLTPWILLFSFNFKNYLKRIPINKLIIIENLINPTIWKRKFNDNPNLVIKMKDLVKSINL